jgi:hypothetical protein
MNKKIMFLALGSLLLAPCFPAQAQPQPKAPKIGLLSLAHPGGNVTGLTRLNIRRSNQMWAKTRIFQARADGLFCYPPPSESAWRR